MLKSSPAVKAALEFGSYGAPFEKPVELFCSTSIAELVEEDGPGAVGHAVEEELAFGLHGVVVEVGVLAPGPTGFAATGRAKEDTATGGLVTDCDCLRLNLFVETPDTAAVLDVGAGVGERDLARRGPLKDSISNGA